MERPRGLAFLKGGRPTEAVRDLEDAADQGSNPEHWFHLAWARLRKTDLLKADPKASQKELALAREAWKRAKAAGFKPAHVTELDRPAYQEVLAALDRE